MLRARLLTARACPAEIRSSRAEENLNQNLSALEKSALCVCKKRREEIVRSSSADKAASCDGALHCCPLLSLVDLIHLYALYLFTQLLFSQLLSPVGQPVGDSSKSTTILTL